MDADEEDAVIAPPLQLALLPTKTQLRMLAGQLLKKTAPSSL
jgi:hypothetical protein